MIHDMSLRMESKKGSVEIKYCVCILKKTATKTRFYHSYGQLLYNEASLRILKFKGSSQKKELNKIIKINSNFLA